jgi:hypothetical protein
MDDRGCGEAGTPAEERRRAALTAFLGAGLHSPPSKALIVEVLAAVLAVLELLPGRRAEAARAYRCEHPDRAGVLGDLLAVLDQPGLAAG